MSSAGNCNVQYMERTDTMRTIFVTGSSGFIGSNLVMRLLSGTEELHIVGLDNMNDYYDVSLKQYRVEQIRSLAEKSGCKWTGIVGDLSDKALIERIFTEYHPDIVVNLAAQAGVRYSITNPDAYIQSNLIGFYHILEACRNHPVEHLVYASSSSVYGGNKKVPFSTEDKVDNPVSLYAATKKSNELLAHATASFTISPRPDCGSLRFTDLPADRIWHISASPIS